MSTQQAGKQRVLAVAPMPPEKCAYALARYSRSPDSIRQSMEWVRTHDSQKFLESYYFQYGHASIADLGHVVLCFEGVSELAATEIEDEPLWDGQAKSTRYQDFSKSGFIAPPELNEPEALRYRAAGGRLLDAYKQVSEAAFAYLAGKLPRPDGMTEDAWRRNLAARAFDVARYLLFFGVPTQVGQVTSIRTLEKQIRRLKASEYGELREIGEEIARACASEPACLWGSDPATREPLAPTLARHTDAETHTAESRRALAEWACANLPPARGDAFIDVDLIQPRDVLTDIAATLLYPVTERPYRELYETLADWSESRRREVVDAALAPRGRRDDLLRAFRGGPYVFDIVMDIGAYRDLHRHRRCHQFRQAYRGNLGFDTPDVVIASGMNSVYENAMREALAAMRELPDPAAQYLLPFGARSRFLFKMDFAEVEYIARVRSGVKGHWSYRRVAWRMKEKLEEADPSLRGWIQATPPWVEDPLKR